MQHNNSLLDLEIQLKQLVETSSGRRAFIAALPLLMTACASGGKGRFREGDNSGQEALTVSEEQRLTNQHLKAMAKDYPPVRNKEIQRYISRLGQSIVDKNSLHGAPYKYNFTVVDVPYVNAFALPAGTVFVTAPLMELASTESELAGVVGHEIGHIQARHTAERMHKANKSKNKSMWYGLGGGVLGAGLGYGLGTLLCKKRDKECLTKATKLGAVAGAGGGLLIQKYAFMANSREDEMEADRIGFRTSVKAGFSKDHVGLFYEKLLKMEQKSKKKNVPVLSALADAMSTHPPSKERVKQMRSMAASVSQSSSARVSSRSFKEAQAVAKAFAKKARARAKSKA